MTKTFGGSLPTSSGLHSHYLLMYIRVRGCMLLDSLGPSQLGMYRSDSIELDCMLDERRRHIELSSILANICGPSTICSYLVKCNSHNKQVPTNQHCVLRDGVSAIPTLLIRVPYQNIKKESIRKV